MTDAKPVSGDLSFQDPVLPLEERVSALISLMTAEEKIAALSTDPSVPRLGFRGARHVEGLHGLAMGEPGDWGRGNPVPTTQFPQAYGMGETWDPELLRQAGEAEGIEVRHLFHSPRYDRGGLVVRAPNADLGRDPRWGRTEECYGEDPYFNGVMAAALVRGLQGDHPKYWRTAALLKHFLSNSNENGRAHTSSDYDERLFREYYSVPFRMAVEQGGSRCYMAAYNGVNGVPCCVHPMLRDVTVREWGLDGIICTDGGGLRTMVEQYKFHPDLESGAAACLRAGITQFLDKHTEAVRDALAHGRLTEKDLDAALRGNLRVMARLGLLDPPELVPYTRVATQDPWETEAHRSLARRITEKSVVLLKNSGGLLPLDAGELKSIAVIGSRADTVLLDWYSGTPPYAVTPLAGIRERAGARTETRFADGSDPDEAERLARTSDAVVLCVGNHPTANAPFGKCTTPTDGKEAVDRLSISLAEEELVLRVLGANPRTVVVLITSFPVAIPRIQERACAIVHMTHNSQETGTALAGTLFGDVNPGGRLVQTWPTQLSQLPDMMDYDIRHGRTYLYFRGTPLYPFGFGLSYTVFTYSRLRCSADLLDRDQKVAVSLDVTNTGTRPGDEVVQLYVTYPDSQVARPRRELKGFCRITLRPGETTEVRFLLRGMDLAWWNAERQQWVVEEGRVGIHVGASSADLKLSAFLGVRP